MPWYIHIYYLLSILYRDPTFKNQKPGHLGKFGGRRGDKIFNLSHNKKQGNLLTLLQDKLDKIL
jgi:hypothetical protein